MNKITLLVAATALVSCLSTAPAFATSQLFAEAKTQGLPAQNCQYCHVAKVPQKNSYDLNDRGKWLMTEKDKQGAKDIKTDWLKDYPGGKEQK